MALTNNGPIEHRDESEFHASFRADLVDVKDEAVLLSPFLHGGRACQYYALFGDLARRGVKVTIYTRPERELAGESRQEHARVCGSLGAVGVDLKTRPSMHEKLAVLDRTTLWHGSLNRHRRPGVGVGSTAVEWSAGLRREWPATFLSAWMDAKRGSCSTP